MTPGKPRLSNAHRRWAAEELDINVNACGGSLREAALRALQGSQFSPSRDAALAMRVLAGSDECRFTDRDQAVLDAAAERSARREVEEFADGFFALPPDARAEQYESLYSQCESFPRLRLWLQRLHPGLSLVVNVEAEPNDDLRDLVAIVCKQFTAYPDASARLKRDFQQELRNSPERWAEPVAAFVARYPELCQGPGSWVRKRSEHRSAAYAGGAVIRSAFDRFETWNAICKRKLSESRDLRGLFYALIFLLSLVMSWYLRNGGSGKAKSNAPSTIKYRLESLRRVE